MTLADDLAALQRDHGDDAIKAYQSITQNLLNHGDLTTFMGALPAIFDQYGLEATGAAIKLHAERRRGMIERVQSTKARLRP